MNLKINYLSKFNENKSNNIAVFLKSETKSNDLFKIFGKDKHIVTSIEKLKKKENFKIALIKKNKSNLILLFSI